MTKRRATAVFLYIAAVLFGVAFVQRAIPAEDLTSADVILPGVAFVGFLISASLQRGE